MFLCNVKQYTYITLLVMLLTFVSLKIHINHSDLFYFIRQISDKELKIVLFMGIVTIFLHTIFTNTIINIDCTNKKS